MPRVLIGRWTLSVRRLPLFRRLPTLNTQTSTISSIWSKNCSRMEGAGKPRHRSQNPRDEGRAREPIESKPSEFEAISTLPPQHPPEMLPRERRFYAVTTYSAERLGHFQTVTNSDLGLQASDSEHRARARSFIRALVIRSSFVIRLPSRSLGEGWCFFIRSMSFAESPRFRSSDRPNDITM